MTREDFEDIKKAASCEAFKATTPKYARQMIGALIEELEAIYHAQDEREEEFLLIIESVSKEWEL